MLEVGPRKVEERFVINLFLFIFTNLFYFLFFILEHVRRKDMWKVSYIPSGWVFSKDIFHPGVSLGLSIMFHAYCRSCLLFLRICFFAS